MREKMRRMMMTGTDRVEMWRQKFFELSEWVFLCDFLAGFLFGMGLETWRVSVK